MQRARRALVLGIGGGGDVVGALAVARRCEELGTPFVLGGVAWERFADRPVPGAAPGCRDRRRPSRSATDAVLAGPETATARGVRFSEVARWPRTWATRPC